MPSTSSRLGLNVWTDADIFDVNEVNENFSKIEEAVDLKNSSTITINNGTSLRGTWRVKRYYDDTVEMSIRVSTTAICNTVTGNVYISPTLIVSLPNAVITSVDNIQISVATGSASSICWAINLTSPTNTNDVQFCLAAPSNENGTAATRYVSITIKGVA